MKLNIHVQTQTLITFLCSPGGNQNLSSVKRLVETVLWVTQQFIMHLKCIFDPVSDPMTLRVQLERTLFTTTSNKVEA